MLIYLRGGAALSSLPIVHRGSAVDQRGGSRKRLSCANPVGSPVCIVEVSEELYPSSSSFSSFAALP